jgi:hypothetical protein
MTDTRNYTDRMPDGRRITFADIQLGWWIQIYVGSWPYDTACGYVTAIHGGGAVTADIDGQGSRFVPRHRLCSTLRPVDN